MKVDQKQLDALAVRLESSNFELHGSVVRKLVSLIAEFAALRGLVVERLGGDKVTGEPEKPCAAALDTTSALLALETAVRSDFDHGRALYVHHDDPTNARIPLASVERIRSALLAITRARTRA